MDNSPIDQSDSQRVAASELRQFVERIERLRGEMADLKEQEKEVFAELKSRGYMSRPIRTLIKERATDPDKLAEDQAVLEMYREALSS
ncbi:DUF2312 domain-containing protein [Sulfitobacter sp. 1A13679]|uniref:DUF2312 domain-containing protein n=1 Tax=Sulfitobacter sp. 1A13679 TaxID=3368597 RepID=UPI00374593DF